MKLQSEYISFRCMASSYITFHTHVHDLSLNYLECNHSHIQDTFLSTYTISLYSLKSLLFRFKCAYCKFQQQKWKDDQALHCHLARPFDERVGSAARNTGEFHGIPWDATGCHGMTWDAMGCQRLKRLDVNVAGIGNSVWNLPIKWYIQKVHCMCFQKVPTMSFSKHNHTHTHTSLENLRVYLPSTSELLMRSVYHLQRSVLNLSSERGLEHTSVGVTRSWAEMYNTNSQSLTGIIKSSAKKSISQ